MIKLLLLISGILAVGSVMIWRVWPKSMPLPEAERQRIFETKDFEGILGKPILDAPLKNGNPYMYSESKGPECINRGLMKNGIVESKPYNFRSMYQICNDEKDIESLFNGNKLMGKLPGVRTDILSSEKTTGFVTAYTGIGTFYVFAYKENVFFSIQIEPEIEVDKEAVLKTVLEKMGRIRKPAP